MQESAIDSNRLRVVYELAEVKPFCTFALEKKLLNSVGMPIPIFGLTRCWKIRLSFINHSI